MKLEIYHFLTIRIKWKDLENVYFEVEKKFVCLCHDCYYEFTQSALSANYLYLLLTQKGSGRPAYHITKECLVQLCSFQFSWCKISDMFGVFRWTVCAVFKNMYFLICRNFPTFQKTELTI